MAFFEEPDEPSKPQSPETFTKIGRIGRIVANEYGYVEFDDFKDNMVRSSVFYRGNVEGYRECNRHATLKEFLPAGTRVNCTVYPENDRGKIYLMVVKVERVEPYRPSLLVRARTLKTRLLEGMHIHT